MAVVSMAVLNIRNLKFPVVREWKKKMINWNLRVHRPTSPPAPPDSGW